MPGGPEPFPPAKPCAGDTGGVFPVPPGLGVAPGPPPPPPDPPLTTGGAG